MQRMTYARARSLIKTGDCIGLATSTATARVVRGVQRLAGLAHADITHTAVAHWVGDRLFAVEMSSAGNVYRPLSQYVGLHIVVSEPPAGCDLACFDEALVRATETHVPYGFFDLARIGLRLLPRRLINTDAWGGDGGDDQVCSFFARRVYALMGADVSGIARLPAPAEVTAALRTRLVIGSSP